jgi:hypothetical protein
MKIGCGVSSQVTGGLKSPGGEREIYFDNQ